MLKIEETSMRAILFLLFLFHGSQCYATPNIKGSDDPSVTIMVFSAFTCPYCAEGAKQLAALDGRYGPRLRIVYKHFPISFTPEGLLSHRAASAAGDQAKFWAMHDRLFGSKVVSLEAIERIAKEIGLDLPKFRISMSTRRTNIEADIAEAHALNVKVTPTYFVDGFKLEGQQDPETFSRIIENRL